MERTLSTFRIDETSARQHLLARTVRPAAKFAAGNQAARRYAPGFSPIVAFADQLRPDLH